MNFLSIFVIVVVVIVVVVGVGVGVVVVVVVVLRGKTEGSFMEEKRRRRKGKRRGERRGDIMIGFKTIEKKERTRERERHFGGEERRGRRGAWKWSGVEKKFFFFFSFFFLI